MQSLGHLFVLGGWFRCGFNTSSNHGRRCLEGPLRSPLSHCSSWEGFGSGEPSVIWDGDDRIGELPLTTWLDGESRLEGDRLGDSSGEDWTGERVRRGVPCGRSLWAGAGDADFPSVSRCGLIGLALMSGLGEIHRVGARGELATIGLSV